MNNQNPFQEAIKALMAMSALNDRVLSEDAVDMLISDLKEFPVDGVLQALKRCRIEVNRFPTVAEIIKRIPGQQENTQELLGRIFEAVDLFGYVRPNDARKHIGEVGWKAVSYFGGWQRICDFPSDQSSALRAQLRQATESSIEVWARSEKFLSAPEEQKQITTKSEQSLSDDEVNEQLKKLREQVGENSIFSDLFSEKDAV